MADSYIVQIYRRSPAGGLYGLVERIGDGGLARFGSIEELWGLLGTEPKDPGKSGKGGAAARPRPVQGGKTNRAKDKARRNQ